ncbi:chitobiosyldiphosphodolichol beta-mannosyltransferase [Brachionichthys hirsutus]|uniref:chitobiosyldiphosphodolichol beta-mannosyltransferase n=1 Tax=Brachionichthys hirsutus TaxID=412623 RepID=UPI0036050BAF
MASSGASAVFVAVFALGAALLPVYYAPCSGVALPAACGAVLTGLVVLCLRALRHRDAGTDRRVCVLVLGDIGRSPRMQYHALSLSEHGYHVTFVGFLESRPHQDVLSRETIRIVPIADVRGVLGPELIRYVTKVILQFLQLLLVLLTMETQSQVLLQNPPGLPGIAAVWLVHVLRGSRFIIDWHNYGYTIMALSLGHRHPAVLLAKWYERVFGRLASRSLCVTEAMREDLQRNWGIRATTLYDRPPSVFRETPLEQRHGLFLRLAGICPQLQGGSDEDGAGVEKTLFSVRDLADDAVALRAERPALLLSSTSWTEDEDFSVLLEALEEYDGVVEGGAALPPLVCVITGKGPQKEHYRRRIDGLRLEHVTICTPWLEAEDYPLLLGSADLGVCLHTSSSGLDLPMKVVDMFGCCLPVCAIHFTCLAELVRHEENGLVFRGSRELALQLKSLLSEFPRSEGRLGSFKRNLQASRGQRWDDNWNQTVLPLLSPP